MNTNPYPIPLCAPVAGLASTGHSICQTYQRCQDDDVPPSAERIHQLQINPGPIQQGYGEYIVFQQTAYTVASPDKELFTKTYRVINAMTPYAITHREPGFAAMHDCAARTKIISEKIRAINPSLEVAFIPRTLYDTFLIRQCIQEDLNCKSACQFESASAFEDIRSFKKDQTKYQAYLERSANERAKRRCWHLCCFKNNGKDTDPSVLDKK